MNKITPLEIVKPSINENAIFHAKDLTQRCESGEFNEILYVAFRPDGSYATGQSACLNIKERIGVLFQLILDMNDSTKD